MPQHRTKQEKIEAQVRRDEHLKYSLDDVTVASKPLSFAEAFKQKADKPTATNKLLNPQFIRKDLLHTAISTIVVLGILLATWQVLR